MDYNLGDSQNVSARIQDENNAYKFQETCLKQLYPDDLNNNGALFIAGHLKINYTVSQIFAKGFWSATVAIQFYCSFGCLKAKTN